MTDMITEADGFLHIDLPSQTLNQRQMSAILYNLTGQVYTFATASDMRWGADGKVLHMGEHYPDGFVQLMPYTLDDGFWDWYCVQRDEQQFFISEQACVLHFISYWLKWKHEKERQRKEGVEVNVLAEGPTRILEATITDACILTARVEHNGFKGGDSGHGGFVHVSIRDESSTDMEQDGEPVHEITFSVRGDAERRSLAQAFEIMAKELQENPFPSK